MKPVDQIIFDRGHGDCLRACVASILELPLDEVPNFSDERLVCPDTKLRMWLTVCGMALIDIALFRKDGDGQLTPIAFSLAYVTAPDMHCILSVPSPRYPSNEICHAVVGVADGWGFRVVHDPHPSRASMEAGKDATGVSWIVAKADMNKDNP